MARKKTEQQVADPRVWKLPEERINTKGDNFVSSSNNWLLNMGCFV